MKKSAHRFRTFDSKETSRLSLHEAYRQVMSSVTVIAHLMEPYRENATVHNALCAFVCGMAMANGKQILMLQEGIIRQPIDYRDIIIPYTHHDIIPSYISKIARATSDTLYSLKPKYESAPTRLLEQIDLGEVAAENEIQALNDYFVKTPHYQQAEQMHARLVVGRKGAGKTAIFYKVRNKIQHSGHSLVVDLKPEGHQLMKLREFVLDHMSAGTQEHTLTAFWNYLLLLEIARKILGFERTGAYHDEESLKKYNELEKIYRAHRPIDEGDFSERLMNLVDSIVQEFPKYEKDAKNRSITSFIYQHDIKQLNRKIAEFSYNYETVLLLFDNIDKGWSTNITSEADVAIVRTLLEASRKIERSLNAKGVNFKNIVFLRKDICDLLLEYTPDRGKDAVADIDWSDTHLIKKLLLNRFSFVKGLQGEFEEVWSDVFDQHVGGEDSFKYILNRTLQRPRDILNFVRKCIQVAVSRGHKKVTEEDIESAEKQFSEDMLRDTRFEIRDVFPDYPDLLHSFIGQRSELSRDDLVLILMEIGISIEEFDKVIDSLLWFAFLGVVHKGEPRYSYEVLYNLPKLKGFINKQHSSSIAYTIHPAFRSSLEVV